MNSGTTSTRRIEIFVLASFVGLFLLMFAFPANAQETYEIDAAEALFADSSIVGPFGCSSINECKETCSVDSRKAVCIDFAVSHEIMSQGQADRALLLLQDGGPGGCSDHGSCRQFCTSSAANRSICLEFAEANGFVSHDQARRERKFIESDIGCSSEAQCKRFCRERENQDKCVEFALDSDIVSSPKKDILRELVDKSPALSDLRKRRPDITKKAGDVDKEQLRDILDKEGGPDGCTNFRDCRIVCDQEDNHDKCLSFSERHELISQKHAEQVRAFIERQGPDGCRGEACRVLCEIKGNEEICLDFARENNLLTDGQFERIKRARTIRSELDSFSVQFGCSTIETCREVCSKGANQERCFDFAKEKNLLRESDEINDRFHKAQDIEPKKIRPLQDPTIDVDLNRARDAGDGFRQLDQLERDETIRRDEIRESNRSLRRLGGSILNALGAF